MGGVYIRVVRGWGSQGSSSAAVMLAKLPPLLPLRATPMPRIGQKLTSVLASLTSR